MAGVIPVFILNNQLPAFEEKAFTTAEICSAVEKTSGFDSIEGAQRIGGLWRIYPRSQDARLKILVQGFTIRHVRVEVKNKNPFLVATADGEREKESTKLIINNVPLSYSDEDILKNVKRLDVTIRSKLISERARDDNGKLTRWKTGRRFLYMDPPADPLPKIIEMGPFRASLYHKEQRQQDKECRRCFEKGHQTTDCPNNIKCHQCFQEGHKAGDPQCHLYPPSVWENEGDSTDRQTDSRTMEEHSVEREEGSEDTQASGKDKSQPGNANADKDEESNNTPARSPRARSRGRQQKRSSQKHVPGQTDLKFLREGSRSTSQKRPRSADRSPHESKQEKLQRRNLDQDITDAASSDEDEFVEVQTGPE